MKELLRNKNMRQKGFASAAETVFPGKMRKRAGLASPECSVGYMSAAGILFLKGLMQGLESALNSQRLRLR